MLEARFTDFVHFVFRMPITQADLARLIKAAAHNRKERFQLVSLAGKQPSIVYELDEDDVVDYLRTELRKEGRRLAQQGTIDLQPRP